MLAHGVAAVVKVPQLGALVARVPLAKLVAQGQDAFFSPRLVLISAAAANASNCSGVTFVTTTGNSFAAAAIEASYSAIAPGPAPKPGTFA